ncbi:MAG: glycosyltransferase family 2 protein [Desulfobulbaceae bacterium]|nr:glycosyltransferase family 2 protein [Desulfobulbaceae bacterium]
MSVNSSIFKLKPSISVVVPVYNSCDSLMELNFRLCKVLKEICSDYEIIFINDASQDDSWSVIEQVIRENKLASGINLMRNYGQHNALLCGIRAACHEMVLTIDDDLQHPPEHIPLLLDKLLEGYDVVYGVPTEERHDIWRNVASQLTKIVLQNAMGADVARNISAFRIFRTQLRDAFQNYKNTYVSIDVLLTWATTNFTAVRVRHENRALGVSNYTIPKLIIHALNLVTGFSALPLQLASLIGFACTIFGLIILTWVVGRYFFHGSIVPGFPFLASIIAIFSGAQLFSLGIIGEYLARIHFRSMERPTYTIRSSIQKQGSNEN